MAAEPETEPGRASQSERPTAVTIRPRAPAAPAAWRRYRADLGQPLARKLLPRQLRRCVRGQRRRNGLLLRIDDQGGGRSDRPRRRAASVAAGLAAGDRRDRRRAIPAWLHTNLVDYFDEPMLVSGWPVAFVTDVARRVFRGPADLRPAPSRHSVSYCCCRLPLTRSASWRSQSPTRREFASGRPRRRRCRDCRGRGVAASWRQEFLALPGRARHAVVDCAAVERFASGARARPDPAVPAARGARPRLLRRRSARTPATRSASSSGSAAIPPRRRCSCSASSTAASRYTRSKPEPGPCRSRRSWVVPLACWLVSRSPGRLGCTCRTGCHGAAWFRSVSRPSAGSASVCSSRPRSSRPGSCDRRSAWACCSPPCLARSSPS